MPPMRPRRVDRYAADALEAALDGALSPDSDESIRVRLRGIARENASCLRDALVMLGVAPSADDYHTNRARRLLEAALEDRPVEPPPPDRVLIFEREKRLDELPLDDAYAELCKLEPRLSDLMAWAARHDQPRPRPGLRAGAKDLRRLARLQNAVGELVGPAVASAEPLLRSPIAARVATTYVLSLDGFPTSGAAARPSSR